MPIVMVRHNKYDFGRILHDLFDGTFMITHRGRSYGNYVFMVKATVTTDLFSPDCLLSLCVVLGREKNYLRKKVSCRLVCSRM